MPTPTEWRLLARCRGIDTELFFPDGHGEVYRPQIEAAKVICRGCEVRSDCLADAMGDEYGIRGGLTPEERKLIKRGRILVSV